MAAALHNFSLLKNHNGIGVAHCGEPVGNDEDSAALHELVHFLHPNHGPGFYAVMDRLMPDWKEKRARLKGCALQKP